MSWNAKTLHVGPTGRSHRIGETRRRPGSRVKYAKGDKPLPLELACHPQRLTPTPLHPGCVKRSMPQYGRANSLACTYKMDDFWLGVGLWAETEGYWRVYCPLRGETLGYAECHDALAYRIAAAREGVTLEVYRD